MASSTKNQELIDVVFTWSIDDVLNKDFYENKGNPRCSICSIQKTKKSVSPNLQEAMRTFNLNTSQETAVWCCISARDCNHQDTVNLIWGPPGTGKTKTVGCLLFTLWKMKCCTLTCALTNNAVLEAAARFMSLVTGSLEYDVYGLGDIIVFGNGKRMKIDGFQELSQVFLENRVSDLAACLKVDDEEEEEFEIRDVVFAVANGREIVLKEKICKRVEFGRSLFERLASLEHTRHLLNVQYRMHPMISLFPNKEFYDKKLLNGPNVEEKSYKKQFLEGSMFGSYSFIHLAHGKVEFDQTKSGKNMVEVAVIVELVAKLYKGCEEDVIIISTVTGVGNGSVGFLATSERANVIFDDDFFQSIGDIKNPKSYKVDENGCLSNEIDAMSLTKEVGSSSSTSWSSRSRLSQNGRKQ
ncbi:hypothetical protein L1987_33994 [Smallanthus sonchifolius]|uniref:Uncharacterized protein n=1 Tax=Smallanthus sonchifolius TaxID=185202 RepID=A0ACB9HU33_9ASTR|nr:hypothetical protein L1987_33994 [Smallanthus sonchifolius]